ncbi:MAG: hydroxyacid dehydrogenase [Candidatus Bathyarchaeia archaeon]
MAERILICDEVHPDGIDILRRKGFQVDVRLDLSGEGLKEELPKYSAVIVRGRTKLTRDLLRGAGGLKLIVRAGVGLDNIDLDAANELGIKVMATPEATTQSVAELTIGLILSLLRRIPFNDAALKGGKWVKSGSMGRELRGSLLGVVGAGGRIGSEVARIAKIGFGAEVIGFDIVDISRRASEIGFRIAGSLEELLRESDIVTVHVPYSPSTHHLIDRRRIGLMKDGALLVNTSRAEVIDGMAALEALKAGKLGGLALDVFTKEPPVDAWERELVGSDKCVCTCHIGAQTLEGQRRASLAAAERVCAFFGV